MKPPFIEFETSEGAAESGPSYDDIASQSLVESEAVEEAAPVEEAAVEETPALDEPPAWFKQYMERADPLLNAVAEAIQPEPQPQQQVDLSQLDMQNPEHVAWLIQYQIKQQMAPYEPIMGAQAEQQGREVANKFFDQIEAEPGVGKFDRDQALIAYQALMAENPGAEPERVLDYAARQVAGYEQRVRQEAVDAYKAQQAAEDEKLRNLAGVKNQPSTGTGAAVENEEMPSGRDKYEILAERWDARQRTSGLGV